MADNDPTTSGPSLEPRVAVLEQIARNTDTSLADIRTEMRDLRAEMREIRTRQDRDFRWLIGLYLAGTGTLLGVMAHGFHWM